MLIKNIKKYKTNILFPAGFEPATLRVWGARDNHYTTETHTSFGLLNSEGYKYITWIISWHIRIKSKKKVIII